jgi:hypothetical protein
MQLNDFEHEDEKILFDNKNREENMLWHKVHEEILFNNKMNEHKLRMEEASFRLEELRKDKIMLRTMRAIDILDTIHEKKNIDEVTKNKFVILVKELIFGKEDVGETTFNI